MLPKTFRFIVHNRLARFVAGAALVFALGDTAQAVLYNWVNTSAGLTGTNSFTLAASFSVPDAAVADSAASPGEITAFSATTVASNFNSLLSGNFSTLGSSSEYLLDAALNVVDGQLRSSTTGMAFGGMAFYDLLITPTTWQQTIQFTYNGQRQSIVFNGTGNWMPRVDPPPTNTVPDATSTACALGLAMVALTGICRRKPPGTQLSAHQPRQ